MKLHTIRYLLLAVTGLFFFSCKAQQTPIMTFQKNNDTIRTQQEAIFVIQLESSYGNGYQWQMTNAEKENIVRLDSTSVFRPSNYDNSQLEESNKIWEKFHFKAIKKGTLSLHFEQVRIWQKSSVTDSVDFRVIVK